MAVAKTGDGKVAVVTTPSSLSFPSIEKLKGIINYHNWQFTMKMLLKREDLWDCVETETSGNESNKMKALAKICLSVTSTAYPHVRNAKTPHEAWKNLQKVYDYKGLCRRLGLLRSLCSTKLADHECMETYLFNLTCTSQQLSDIGSPLDDDFLAVIILSGLPPDYDPLIMTFENDSKLSTDNVKSKLLQEYQRRRDNGSTTALAARSSTDGALSDN